MLLVCQPKNYGRVRFWTPKSWQLKKNLYLLNIWAFTLSDRYFDIQLFKFKCFFNTKSFDIYISTENLQ